MLCQETKHGLDKSYVGGGAYALAYLSIIHGWFMKRKQRKMRLNLASNPLTTTTHL